MREKITAATVARGEAPGLAEWIAEVSPHVSEILLLDGGCRPGVLERATAGFPSSVRIIDSPPRLRRFPEARIMRMATRPFVLRLDPGHRVLDTFWENVAEYARLLDSRKYSGIELPVVRTRLSERVEIVAAAAGAAAGNGDFTPQGRAQTVLLRGGALNIPPDKIFRGKDLLIISDVTQSPPPRIGVSILAHMSPEVVFDQIENVRAFIPGAAIVLHLSRPFALSGSIDRERLEKIEGVFINPENIETGWSRTSLTLAILSNFKHLSKAAPFDYFLLNSSNDLYVRPGAERHIALYDAGCALDPLAVNSSPNSPAARIDRGFYAMREHLGGAFAYVSGHEGSFFRKELFEEMAPLIDRYARQDVRPFLGFGKPEGDYGKEEYYLPTAAGALARSLGPRVIYRVWSGPSILMKDVESVREGRFETLVHKQEGNFFGVKRVPRVFDDPIRVYIRGLTREQAGRERA